MLKVPAGLLRKATTLRVFHLKAELEAMSSYPSYGFLHQDGHDSQNVLGSARLLNTISSTIPALPSTLEHQGRLTLNTGVTCANWCSLELPARDKSTMTTSQEILKISLLQGRRVSTPPASIAKGWNSASSWCNGKAHELSNYTCHIQFCGCGDRQALGARFCTHADGVTQAR